MPRQSVISSVGLFDGITHHSLLTLYGLPARYVARHSFAFGGSSVGRYPDTSRCPWPFRASGWQPPWDVEPNV